MIGPVLDADGVAVTGAVVGDFKLSKNGGSPAALNGSTTLTHRHTGHYSLASAAGDFDSVGTAQFTLDKTTDACAPVSFDVIEEVIYDALYAASANAWAGAAGSSIAGANVLQWLGSAPSAPAFAGVPVVDVGAWVGVGAQGAAGRPQVDVELWNGSAVATPTVAGVPEVDVTHVAGSTTDVSTIPASIAAILVDTSTTLQAELDGIQADTEDIQTRLPATLDGTNMRAKLADGVTHGGTAAMLRLGSSNSTPALYVTHDGSIANGVAVKFEGITGAFGGATGFWISGASSNGIGLLVGGGLAGIDVAQSVLFESDFTVVGGIIANLTGSVSGSVGSVSAGGITAASFGSGAIDAAAMNVNGSEFTAIPWNAAWDAEVQSEVIDALQETVPDTVPADGSRPNIQQAVRMILQTLIEGGISGTTWTIKKEDGSTTLFTVTLDSDTTPTAKTRAT